MRDAYGGIVNITFIVVFIVIISGYLAFSVNYNKAFRVKNKIISAIEECEGISKNDTSDCAHQAIEGYMQQVGYSVPKDFNSSVCTGELSTVGNGWCAQENVVSTGELGNKSYYTVVTAVNIDLPIINRILPSMKLFQVSGNTKTITKH